MLAKIELDNLLPCSTPIVLDAVVCFHGFSLFPDQYRSRTRLAGLPPLPRHLYYAQTRLSNQYVHDPSADEKEALGYLE